MLYIRQAAPRAAIEESSLPKILLEAELRDLQERVTAHLAAIPASWGVDADGVTGPDAGREEDAGSSRPRTGWMRSPAWAGRPPPR